MIVFLYKNENQLNSIPPINLLHTLPLPSYKRILLPFVEFILLQGVKMVFEVGGSILFLLGYLVYSLLIKRVSIKEFKQEIKALKED